MRALKPLIAWAVCTALITPLTCAVVAGLLLRRLESLL